MEVYVQALRVVWLVTMAVAVLGFARVPIERAVELKKDNNTDIGLEEKEERSETASK